MQILNFSLWRRLGAINASYDVSKIRLQQTTSLHASERGLADQGRSGRVLAFLGPISQRSITMLRCVAIALALSTVAALQPPASRAAATAKANPAAVDLYSRATTASAARDVALYGMFGPSEAEKRAEQARIDAEQEALNEKFRKESESDFAFMSVFGVVTRGRGVLVGCLRV